MLQKSFVFMMLLAASLIGISSAAHHQHIEGQIPTPTPTPRTNAIVQLQGMVVAAYIVSASKTCTALIDLPIGQLNLLKLPPDTSISLTAPIESCTLFGLAKISKTPIQFQIPGPVPTAPSSTTRYSASTVIL
jgi:hypothetical protein